MDIGTAVNNETTIIKTQVRCYLCEGIIFGNLEYTGDFYCKCLSKMKFSDFVPIISVLDKMLNIKNFLSRNFYIYLTIEQEKELLEILEGK